MVPLEKTLEHHGWPALVKATPTSVILGQKNHPARLEGAFPPGEYVKKYHERHALPEFCICLEGKCALRVSNCSYVLRSGDICFIGRNQRHFESYYEQAQTYGILWVIFSSVNRVFIHHGRYRNRDYRLVQALHIRVPDELVGLMDGLIEAPDDWNRVRESLGRTKEIIDTGLRNGAPKEKYSFIEDKEHQYHMGLVQKAKQYIIEHHLEKLTLQQVARTVRLNPKYFEKLFHEIEGNTVLQYVHLIRLNDSLALLNDSTLNISEIAKQCGFGEYINFSRIFRKHYGLSPGQFRKLYCPITE